MNNYNYTLKILALVGEGSPPRPLPPATARKQSASSPTSVTFMPKDKAIAIARCNSTSTSGLPKYRVKPITIATPKKNSSPTIINRVVENRLPPAEISIGHQITPGTAQVTLSDPTISNSLTFMPKTKVLPGPAGSKGSSRTFSPLFKKRPFMNHPAGSAALVGDSYVTSPTSSMRTSMGVARAKPSPSTTYFLTQNYNPPSGVASMMDGHRPVPAAMLASTPNITSTTSSITTSIPGPKVVEACRPQSTEPVFTNEKVSSNHTNGNGPAAPKPILYVGIILERPETLKSWGLVFTKEARDHALIVRVTSPSKLNGPSVKWCEIANSAPNPSMLYGKNSPDITAEKFETTLVRNFPPPCTDRRLRDAGLLVPYLTPGDAIVAINGIPTAVFPTMHHFASYIRENCQRKITIVAMRHENVRMAALGRMPAQLDGVDQQKERGRVSENQTTNDRIAKAVKGAWKLVLFCRSSNQVKRKAAPLPAEKKRPKIYIPPVYTNSLFRDEGGKPFIYCDCDNSDYDPEDGKRIHAFMNDEIEKTFHRWLKKRKATWRERRCISQTARGAVDEEREELTVQPEFWLANGHESFDQWLSASKSKWTRSYSWHIERREALQSECEKEVHFPMIATTIETQALLNQFGNWLSTRKQQWRLERRKRQRYRVELPGLLTEDEKTCPATDTSSGDGDDPNTYATNSNQTMYFDEILEVEEERLAIKEEATPHHPMDISWVFNSQQGAPDDIIANIMTYLLPSDHGNLLCLSYTCNFLFKQRQDMWKSLCPKRWVLPRRPRKSWSAMYINKIRAEEETSRKRSDDLLVKANIIIDKGDQLNKLDKLVRKGERDFDFSVNYISCVVLERNSLTNIAVIAKRHKIVKWLIEEKLADIESCDRGQFTPLMNAAWNGDKHIVRYLLGKGSDRAKVGYNHCSQGLAPASFEGLNAEGWARKRGHNEVADLIHFGL